MGWGGAERSPLAGEVKQSIHCGSSRWTTTTSTFDSNGRIWPLPQGILRFTCCDKPNRHSYNKCWRFATSFVQSIQECQQGSRSIPDNHNIPAELWQRLQDCCCRARYLCCCCEVCQIILSNKHLNGATKRITPLLLNTCCDHMDIGKERGMAKKCCNASVDSFWLEAHCWSELGITCGVDNTTDDVTLFRRPSASGQQGIDSCKTAAINFVGWQGELLH